MSRQQAHFITRAGELPTRVPQSDACARCGSIIWFGTDGNGHLLEQCPHCDWGQPAPKPEPAVRCEHGVAGHCESCDAKRAAIRRGIQEYRESRLNDPTYHAKRSRAALQGWLTRSIPADERPERDRACRNGQPCTHCGEPVPPGAKRKTCSDRCSRLRRMRIRERWNRRGAS